MPKSVDRSPFERAAREGLLGADGEQLSISNSENRGKGCPLAADQGMWIEPFFDAIAEGATINAAAKVAGVHPTRVYKKRRDDAVFRARWNEVAKLSTPLLEMEAQRRAYHGVDKPVYQQGALVGYERRYSDTLLIFMLKARNPAKYRDGGDADGRGNVQINIQVDTISQAPAELPVIDMADVPSAEAPQATIAEGAPALIPPTP